MADYPKTWSSEEDLHSTWDAARREFPDEFERVIQRELDAFEKAMPDLRSEFQTIVLSYAEHPSKEV